MGIISKARGFAAAAHNGQLRKYTNEPYINHPINVAKIVLSVTCDSEMIAAALLHDVVEDTEYTIQNMWQNFGQRVADMVDDLTDTSKPSDGNRKVRKIIDLNHTAKASDISKTIKLADLIDNTSTILKYDPKFAKVYMAEKKALLNVLTDGDKTLYKQASKVVSDYYNAHNKPLHTDTATQPRR